MKHTKIISLLLCRHFYANLQEANCDTRVLRVNFIPSNVFPFITLNFTAWRLHKASHQSQKLHNYALTVRGDLYRLFCPTAARPNVRVSYRTVSSLSSIGSSEQILFVILKIFRIFSIDFLTWHYWSIYRQSSFCHYVIFIYALQPNVAVIGIVLFCRSAKYLSITFSISS